MSAYDVRRIKTPGMHAVGGVAGLYLCYHSPQGRSWILRATKVDGSGNRPELGLGPYPEVSLEAARERAQKMKEQLRQGFNPQEEQRRKIQERKAEAARRLTFREAAEQFWPVKQEEFTNEKHKAQWIGTLRDHAYPRIGALGVVDITRAHIVEVLAPIWIKTTDTASKLRGRIECVMSYAYALLEIENRKNPAAWDDGLNALLPSAATLIKQKRTHHPALPWKRIPEFMAKLRAKGGIAARALEFQILTASRSKEVRGALWSEIDLVEKVWTVPASRMKGKRMHRVPISDAAMKLLEALPRTDGYIFPGMKRGTMLSSDTLGKVIDDMHEADLKQKSKGFTDPNMDNRIATPHGSARSSFKDWARNSCGARYLDEVFELAIAHVNSGKTRAAYDRDELLEVRRPLMQEWDLFCAVPMPAANDATMPADTTAGSLVAIRQAS
jgi:integrase